ncbi:11183_t:CDS:1, partial [Gigaspora margarita]
MEWRTPEQFRSEPNPSWSGLKICLKIWCETGAILSKFGMAP